MTDGHSEAATAPQKESAVLSWFNSYWDPRRGSPGVRAKLRRCRSPLDAMMIPAALELAKRMGALKENRADGRSAPALDKTLNLARVLGQVQKHDGTVPPIMRQLGWKSFPGDKSDVEAGAERPLLSEIRFRRLVSGHDDEQIVTAFIRLIRLAGGTVNVVRLSRDFLDVNNEARRDELKKRWAQEYYAAFEQKNINNTNPLTDSTENSQ